MTKNLGSELLIFLLLRTGLRLDLVANMLGMHKATVHDWIMSTNLIQVAPATCVKGMHIQPEGFLVFRFKGLNGYAFSQVFTKVREHIQSLYQTENEKFLMVLAFVIAHELFQKEYVAHLARFASDVYPARQVTVSHLWQFVRFREAGLIREVLCRCGHSAPESLSISSGTHCSCRLPERNRKYWMDFGSAIDQIVADTEKGVIANRSQVDAVLQRALLEASLGVLGIVEKPT